MKHRSDESSDTAVIQRVISGDVNAFETLIERYQPYVFSIVCRHIPNPQVDEVAHDVFVRAFKGLSGYSKKSGFKQWLSGICVRTCYDFWREKYRMKEVPFSQLTETHQQWLEQNISDDAADRFEAGGQNKEALEVLDWALGRLSAADRMIIELVYMEGYSHKEAGKLLGWSVANIKIRAFRARKKLQSILTSKKNRGDM